jgi:hypothetical protein
MGATPVAGKELGDVSLGARDVERRSALVLAFVLMVEFEIEFAPRLALDAGSAVSTIQLVVAKATRAIRIVPRFMSDLFLADRARCEVATGPDIISAGNSPVSLVSIERVLVPSKRAQLDR